METRDPNLTTLGPGWCRDDGYVIGYAVAAGDFVGYFPVRHESGNLPEKKVVNWLKKQLATPNIEKVMHNSMYDLGWLRWAGHRSPRQDNRYHDSRATAEREPSVLQSELTMAGEYLGETRTKRCYASAAEMYGVDAKSGMWQLDSSFVGRYAEQDAAVTLRLWDRLRIDLVKEECTIFELESSSVACAARHEDSAVLGLT